MNAQEAYNKARTINDVKSKTAINLVTKKIEKAANKGEFNACISYEEYSLVKEYFNNLGYRLIDWGDQRDGNDYRISWENPKN